MTVYLDIIFIPMYIYKIAKYLYHRLYQFILYLAISPCYLNNLEVVISLLQMKSYNYERNIYLFQNIWKIKIKFKPISTLGYSHLFNVYFHNYTNVSLSLEFSFDIISWQISKWLNMLWKHLCSDCVIFCQIYKL